VREKWKEPLSKGVKKIMKLENLIAVGKKTTYLLHNGSTS